MGAAAPFIIQGVIMVAGALVKTSAQQDYYEQQEQALRMREEQEKLSALNQSRQANDKIEQIMGKQIVYAASSGATPGSFSPIEEKDFDEWSQDRNAINLNLQFKEAAIESEINAIDSRMSWSPILNLFGAGQGIWNTIPFKSGGGKSEGGSTSSPVKASVNVNDEKPDKVKSFVNVGRYYSVHENQNQSIL